MGTTKRRPNGKPRPRQGRPAPIFADWMVQQMGPGVILGIGYPGEPPTAAIGFVSRCQLDGMVADLQRIRQALPDTCSDCD